jgi:hypothetical protein
MVLPFASHKRHAMEAWLLAEQLQWKARQRIAERLVHLEHETVRLMWGRMERGHHASAELGSIVAVT